MKLKQIILYILAAALLLGYSISASAEMVMELPANIEIIEEEAFYGTTSIGKVILSNKTSVIRAKAFADSSISEIVIPNSNTEISETAFDNCNPNLIIRGFKGSNAEVYAISHSFRFAPIETSVILTQSWEDFAGASSSLLQSYEGCVAVSSEGSAYANGRLIVKMEGELPDLTQFNPEAIVRDPENHFLIQFSDSDVAENCADYLSATSGVVYVEPDQNFSGSDMYIDDFETQSFSWGVSATNADAFAADLRKRNVSTSVVVAVVDTGVDAGHPMLSERLVSGYDFVDNDGTPQDGNKHGTHVSGTVIDCTPGLNVFIMPVRVLNNEGRGSNSVVAQGIRYAARNDADVINLSLGGQHSNYTDEAINYALQNGVTVVVAAGNEADNTAYHCPAHISDCITVSAVNQNRQRAYFSNFGNAVDIAAPGVNINSAIPGGGYASLNGTSMATPHVSAAAAMLLCDNPGLSPSNVVSMLQNAATDLGASGWDVYFGAGLLNLEPFIKSGPKQFTISYDANGGSGAPASQTKVEGITLTLSSTEPTRANANTGSYTIMLDANGGNVNPASLTASKTTSYSFKNWNSAANGSGTSYNPRASFTANEDTVLYAQWNSSTAASAVTLPTLTRAGYIFKGWATNRYSATGITGTYTPSKDVTLYAVWESLPQYTITYDANGGSGAPANQSKTQGIDLTLSSVKPSRADGSATGYTVTLDANGGTVDTDSLNAARTISYSFKNWNTKADGTGVSYAPAANYTTDAALSLYAQWNSSTETMAVTLPTPTREGYLFRGWGTSGNASAGVIGEYTPNGSITLYALWDRAQYTVYYHANGGTGAPASQVKDYGISLSLSADKPSHARSSAGSFTVMLDANGGTVGKTSLNAARTTSYTFKEWNTRANGTGAGYDAGASYTANESVTLFAQWEITTTTAPVTLPTPERSGYLFMGWAVDRNAATGVTGLYTASEDVTLYAVWEALPQYTVSYDANGGSGAPENQSKMQGIDLTLSSVKPSRTNESVASYTVFLDANGGTVGTDSVSAARTISYSFKNWNTKADGTGTSYVPAAIYSTDAALSLYAQWNSSTETMAVTLPTPTREGYLFRGWGTSGNASAGVIGEYTPKDNEVLYAVWKPVYIISYNANGGVGEPSTQGKPQGESISLSSVVPTRADNSAGNYTITLDANGGTVRTNSVSVPKITSYSFENWNTEADGSGTSFLPGAEFTIDADVTLYAQWSSNTTTSSVMLPRPYRDDRDFRGWSTTVGISVQFLPGESYTFDGDATLYAIWSRVIVKSGYCGLLEERPPNYALDSDGLLTISTTETGMYRPNSGGSMAPCTDMYNWDISGRPPYYPPWSNTMTSYDLNRVVIFDRVTSIGNQAFIGKTKLTSIAIPSSVTVIGSKAFYNCKSLTDVYYAGSEEQWDQINIGTGNSLLFEATIHFNSNIG